MAQSITKAEAIRKVYIDPIRTVLLIDDKFPMYDRLCVRPAGTGDSPETDVAALKQVEAGPRSESWEPERAGTLWKTCRDRGWACDVDDGGGTGNPNFPHVEKCDLVVLDYHLTSDPNNPLPALRILRQLADSAHSTLVVIYTNAPDLNEVQFQVAAYLHGHRKHADFMKERDLAIWQTELLTWQPAPTRSLLTAYLRDDRDTWSKDTDLSQELRDLEIKAAPSKIIEAAMESLLANKYKAPEHTESTKNRSVKLSDSGGDCLWVQTHNLFLTLVRKSPENAAEGGAVIDSIEKALNEWSPPYLPMVLSYARTEIARGGFRAELESLSDVVLQAAWLYHALSEDSMRHERIRSLFERLIGSYSERVVRDVVAFGDQTFPVSAALPASVLDVVRGLCGERLEAGEREIVHALNEYLATEQTLPSCIQTGTIFKLDGAQKGDVRIWICVTPACDMVPREPGKHTVEFDLHPFRQVRAVRAVIVTDPVKIQDAYSNATRSHNLFISIDGERKVAEVINPNSHTPRVESFIVAGMGVISDNCFTAYSLEKGSSNKLQMATMKMRAFGQMREPYANRYLQQTGHHLSRIGVDFVNLTEISSTEDESLPDSPAGVGGPIRGGKVDPS